MLKHLLVGCVKIGPSRRSSNYTCVYCWPNPFILLITI